MFMRKLLFGLLTGMLLIAGCVSPPRSQWYNDLYKSDRRNSMDRYYGRDFVICLGIALDSAKIKRPGDGSVEYETEECLRRAGWVENKQSEAQ